MKCNQSRPEIELVSPCPYSVTITITPRAHPLHQMNVSTLPIIPMFLVRGLNLLQVWHSAYLCRQSTSFLCASDSDGKYKFLNIKQQKEGLIIFGEKNNHKNSNA